MKMKMEMEKESGIVGRSERKEKDGKRVGDSE
jgi:hypothetical protein